MEPPGHPPGGSGRNRAGAEPVQGARPSASATALSTSKATGTPRQQAEADAALLVKAFVPPPGAKAVSRSPVPSSSLGNGQEGLQPVDDDVVTRTGWWLVPGDPRTLLAWEAARLKARYPPPNGRRAGRRDSCPPGSGGVTLTVMFRARVCGPVLGQASTVIDGCAFLSYTMPGQSPAAIGGPGAGNNLLTEVNQVAGLHWKSP